MIVLLVSIILDSEYSPKCLDLPPRSAPTITQDIVNSQDQKMVAIDIIQQKHAKRYPKVI